jgi:hypothetical protein
VGDAVTVVPHVGSGSGITAVTARLGGAVVATATGAPWTLNVDTRTTIGTATLTVTAAAGSVPKGTVSLTLYGDHAPPTTSFRLLPSAAVTAAPIRGVVTIGARAADDVGVLRVQLLAAGRVVAADTTSPYAFRWQSAPHTGRVTLTLRAYDRAGNAATAQTVVTADNTAPSVVVARAPADRTRHIRRTAYLSVSASDYYGTRMLELIVDGKVTQRYAGRRHRFSVQTWKHGAAMTVRVRAYDRAGNVRLTPARTWYR